MSAVADKLRCVQQQIEDCAIRAGRKASDIRLIAVSKTRTLEEVRAVAACGQRDFGENTVQDALSKIPYLNVTGINWHFIGHLQSKKAGRIPGHFQWLHTVDSLKLAQKLSAAMQNRQQTEPLNCLLQVNVSGEASKSGLAPEVVKPFLEELLESELPLLNWRGLMTIGVKADEVRTRSAFAGLRELQQACADEFALPGFNQLSMGMSGDYCLAVEEGATMVRVGAAIFGPRG